MDFALARTNMVESQIRTNKVTDQHLIDAFEAVPRELFVGEDQQGLAYVDEDLQIAEGRFLMEPMVLARLIQAAAPTSTDAVLDIGCGTGYSTAVLARVAGSAVALEPDQRLAERGNAILNDLGIDNAAVVVGDPKSGYAKQAPYDAILIGGAVDEVPSAVIDQLADGGRIVAVLIDEAGLGRATLLQRVGATVSKRVLFDAAVPPLPGFERKPQFVF